MGEKVFLSPTPYPSEVQELMDYWDEFASISVSCCQPWKSADDRILLNGPSSFNVGFPIRVHCLGIDIRTGALWLTVLKDFSAYLSISSAGLALYFFEVMVCLHFTWCGHSSLDSQEILLENLVHVWPHAGGVLAHSVAHLIPVLAWKLPHAHSNTRRQCKDLVWSHSFWKKQWKICKTSLPAGEVKATPKRLGFCVLKKKLNHRLKKKDVLRLQPKTDLISNKGFNRVNKTSYPCSQKMSLQSEALEGRVQESCYN